MGRRGKAFTHDTFIIIIIITLKVRIIKAIRKKGQVMTYTPTKHSITIDREIKKFHHKNKFMQ